MVNISGCYWQPYDWCVITFPLGQSLQDHTDGEECEQYNTHRYYTVYMHTCVISVMPYGWE